MYLIEKNDNKITITIGPKIEVSETFNKRLYFNNHFQTKRKIQIYINSDKTKSKLKPIENYKNKLN